MIRWIVIVLLTVGLAGSAFWGYQEHQEKNAILIQAENTYQRAFHELTYHMDLLHDKIGTVLAMNSGDQLSPQLSEIWRLTSEAHSDVGQLPLSLLPFNKTEAFLADIGKFSYRTAVRDLDNDPLDTDEVKTLKKLYEESGNIKKELRNVQHLVLKNNLRWMDVQLALVTGDEQADNTIINGFETVEETVGGFPEGNFGPSFTGLSQEKEEYEVPGDPISEQDVEKIARDIFAVNNGTKLDITLSGEGADVPMYSVSYDNGDKHGYMDITKNGGHPLSLLVRRDIQESDVSLYDGVQKSLDFFEKYNFNNMELAQSSQYDNVGVYLFLYKQDEVRVYPDAIQVKVALDNGDVIGVSARDFLMNHKERNIPEPSLSQDEAVAKVNPNVEIQEQSLAIIENDLGEEVLCYEFLGILGQSTYRIFINAEDGFEEKVEKLKQSEVKFD